MKWCPFGVVMSFVLRPHQQEKRRKNPLPTNQSTFPNSFITAQNCFSNFTELQETSGTGTPIKETAPMIKNIDTTVITSSSVQQTDWDEKQKEEKEGHQVVERRDSITEEFFAAQDSINTEIKKDQPLISAESTDIYSTSTSDAGQTKEDSINATDKNLEETTVSTIKRQFSENTTINPHETRLSSKPDTHRTPSPSGSPSRRKNSKDSTGSKGKQFGSRNSVNLNSSTNASLAGRGDEADTVGKLNDNLEQDSQVSSTLNPAPVNSNQFVERSKNPSRLSERAKKKSWYNVLYPNYKSRAEDFKKLFKDVPNDERLIVDYSCALQRDILVQGRLYVSQNYVCFHANIFRWETYLCIKWKDVTSITKEKTALVIPNAISICTAKEKYFFATFATRDKAFLMLFRVWQNTLMNKPMLPQEMWQYVHNCYGDELGLTTDDEDYIDPTSIPNETEGELEFSSALEDTVSLQSGPQNIDFNTATSNSNIFPVSGSGSTSSLGTSATSGKGTSNTKTKKSYFFNTNKSSSASANATSGSDNKASDNNSGGDRRKSTMKPYAKELTLISAEPDEPIIDDSSSNVNATPEVNVSGGVSSAASTKESKNLLSDGKRKVAKNSRQRDETFAKNAETIPTDMSDSSDSEGDKIPFVVTAECNSPHEGRQLVHTILPINVDTLFNMLFSKSKFLVDFHAMRKSTDTNFPDWVTSDEGQKTRTVNVTVQLAASVGPKTSKVTEHQVMRDCSKPGELYSIDINSVNAGIPYADSFSVLMHYCLVRTLDDHTMLSVHAQIKYKKSIWGVVKGFIEKNTWAGLEDFYTSLLHALQSETCIPPAKGKGRRPRRGASTAQTRPSDENSVSALAQAKAEPTEHSLATHSMFLPNVPSANLTMAGELPRSNKWLSLFVIVLLLFLIAVNVILLLKLWKLETRIEEDMNSRARMPNLSSLKQLPNSHQEWMDLLRQQEILHETELRKWHNVLQTAIELLKKTEKTLAELMFR